jgi:hypothetical protein
LNADGPTVRLHDPFRNGETEPYAGAVTGTRARGVGTPEPLKDVGQVTGGDADAGVSD